MTNATALSRYVLIGACLWLTTTALAGAPASRSERPRPSSEPRRLWVPVEDEVYLQEVGEQVAGLIDPEGYLWHEVPDVYAHATPEQALIEGRAQVRRAMAAGIDVTHLDSHMGTLQLHPDYVKTYLQLAVEFDLPVRMASQETLARLGHPELRGAFAAKGVLFPDFFVYDELPNEKQGVRDFWLGVVRDLKQGVTELYIHAGMPNDELKAITGSWQTRSQEFEVFTHDDGMKRLIAEQKITLIGYRPLRDLQRKERPQTGR